MLRPAPSSQGSGSNETPGFDTPEPTGSTEECFPTREALIQGVTERCIEREMEMATGPLLEIGALTGGACCSVRPLRAPRPRREGLGRVQFVRVAVDRLTLARVGVGVPGHGASAVTCFGERCAEASADEAGCPRDQDSSS